VAAKAEVKPKPPAKTKNLFEEDEDGEDLFKSKKKEEKPKPVVAKKPVTKKNILLDKEDSDDDFKKPLPKVPAAKVE
jgi:hypothetical protein